MAPGAQQSASSPLDEPVNFLKGYKGLRAWVDVNGKQAPVYGTESASESESDDAKHLVAYMEAIEGARYSVAVGRCGSAKRFKKPFHVELVIDGEELSYGIEFRPGDEWASERPQKFNCIEEFSFEQVSPDAPERCSFQFVALDRVEEAPGDLNKGLGSIKVNFYRCVGEPDDASEVTSSWKPKQVEGDNRKELIRDGKVTHLSKLGTVVQSRKVFEASDGHTVTDPFASFEFCYRSRAWLEARKLVTPLEDKKPFTKRDEDEKPFMERERKKAELFEKRAQLDAELARLEEGRGEDCKTGLKVKETDDTKPDLPMSQQWQDNPQRWNDVEVMVLED